MPTTSQAKAPSSAYRYLFGPVASSRLGRSLGLDLLGGPICSLDCLYCEVGRTKTHTRTRRRYVPADRLLSETRSWFQDGHRPPDYITLGGQGEPCLNSDMGHVVQGLRREQPSIPVAVLTNSTLLSRPEVQQELASVAAVLPSLDTLVETEFQQLNRPCPDITAVDVAQGLIDFRAQYTGKIFLEILLVHGINDTAENKKRLRDFITELSPHRVDVVTMTRPGACSEARPVSPTILRSWRETFGATMVPENTPPEDRDTTDAPSDGQTIAATITNSLARRPQTAEQLAYALDLPRSEIATTLAALLDQGTVVSLTLSDLPYYGLASSERN